MPSEVERPVLPLDVNFPTPILAALDDFLLDVTFVPLTDIDQRLVELDDRELVIALRQLGYGWLVTNNYKMLRNPRELAAILKAKLTVFAIEGTGHDPLRATGALLLDLPGALRRVVDDQPQVFWLRPRNPQPQSTWDLFTRAAEHRNQDPATLYEEVAVSDEEFDRRIIE